MSDIFISYASEDEKFAKSIASVLESERWSVWRDREKLELNEEFKEPIYKALAEAKCVLVLWSQHSAATSWVWSEARAADDDGKLVHALIEAELKPPHPYEELNVADLSAWDETAEFGAFAQLLRKIEEYAPRESANDTILVYRLEALKNDFERVRKVRDYVQDIKAPLTDESNAQLWDEVLDTVNNRINNWRTDVEKVLSTVSRSDAQSKGRGQDNWKRYNRILRESGELFFETMELLTGLVLRNALFPHAEDERSRTSHVYRIADEMVQRAAGLANKSFRPAVPAGPDSITRTLLCLVRLRFPDWSVWHLPLLACEYGRLFFAQDRALDESLSGTLSRYDARLLRHRSQLFSDVFATYYVGPAYAYVVTYLQLNPATDNVVDDKRAEVVFSTLDHMSQDEKEDPYREVIENLRREWTISTSCARKKPYELPEQELECLTEFARATLIELHANYNSELGYPLETLLHKIPWQGWRVSQDWANQWQEQLQNGQTLEVPIGLGPTNSLRDVLNAGWICRAMSDKSPDELDELAAVMEDSCRNIMEAVPAEEEIEPVIAMATSGQALI